MLPPAPARTARRKLWQDTSCRPDSIVAGVADVLQRTVVTCVRMTCFDRCATMRVHQAGKLRRPDNVAKRPVHERASTCNALLPMNVAL